MSADSEAKAYREGLSHGSPVMPNNQEKFAEDTPPPSSPIKTAAPRDWNSAVIGNPADLKSNLPSPLPQMRGIYIASKTKHADRWRFLRDQVGEPIISTWIDEAGAGESSDLADLWRRCISEASTAQVLILYREPEDVLKGGWIELGAALASGVPVFAVGIEEFTISHDTRIQHFPDMKAAIAAARKLRTSIVTLETKP